MNPEYEKKLEAGIQRELDALTELQAPPALTGRIMRAIDQRSAAPWHGRAWQTWHPMLQGVSLAALLVLFGGICFGVVELTNAAGGSAVSRQVGEWFAALGVIWNTLNVLAGAMATAAGRLGTGFTIGCVLLLTAVYAACVGLGTVCMRLATARG